jgi:hypothetical protein
MSWVDVTTAVGTASAAVVALGLGLRAEWRAVRTEQRQRGEEQRRQAIRVAAWMLVEQDNGEGLEEVEVDDPSLARQKAHIYAVIHNASDEPIWDVTIFTPGFTSVAERSQELRSTEFEDEIVCIAPRETLRLPIKVLTIPYNRKPIKVEFRDNAGREWSRDDRGRLHEGRVAQPEDAWIDKLEKAHSVEGIDHKA